jgi:long-subunit acyl-CoA synthetase (AMP-forming)
LKGLTQASDCKAWLSTEDSKDGPLTKEIAYLPKFALPTLEWMLNSGTQVRYPYDKTFAEAKDDVIVIIHTSGTTGKLLSIVYDTL